MTERYLACALRGKRSERFMQLTTDHGLLALFIELKIPVMDCQW
jgi:hypothetical protein